MIAATLPMQAYAASLAGFERMTVGRLAMLLDGRNPLEAFELAAGNLAPDGLLRGVLADRELAAAWRRAARLRTPAEVWERCQELGLAVLLRDDDGFPPSLLFDPSPPAVLFARGDLNALHGRRVAIVGTRNASSVGRETATTFGLELAKAGVAVISGLARGVDGYAHRGALAARTPEAHDVGRAVAVVASGHDVVYPKEHGLLWHEVAAHGLVLSEAPPGTQPEAFRFPLRNRVIAGLAEVVVVVESRSKGGSLITVNAANDRGVTVMAVPGSLNNRSAQGTNALIRDGCPVALDVDDVLVALSMDTRRVGIAAFDARPRPSAADRTILDLCDEPATVEQLMLGSGRSIVEVSMSLSRLEAGGWLRESSGWFQRCAL